MGKRRRARELALQYLYQWDFHGTADEEAVKDFWETRNESNEVRRFANRIISGVKDDQERIDEFIVGHSRHWKISRMGRIDRNVLRMAVWEFLHCDDIPPKVSIDEAIELGKKFGTTESGSFINGILDNICKKIGKLKGQPPAGDESNEAVGDKPIG